MRKCTRLGGVFRRPGDRAGNARGERYVRHCRGAGAARRVGSKGWAIPAVWSVVARRFLEMVRGAVGGVTAPPAAFPGPCRSVGTGIRSSFWNPALGPGTGGGPRLLPGWSSPASRHTP